MKISLSSFMLHAIWASQLQSIGEIICSYDEYGYLSLILSFCVAPSHCHSAGADGVELRHRFEASYPSSPWLSQDPKPASTWDHALLLLYHSGLCIAMTTPVIPKQLALEDHQVFVSQCFQLQIGPRPTHVCLDAHAHLFSEALWLSPKTAA